MRQTATDRHLAEALGRTLQRLTPDPSVGPQDSASVRLKCALLERLMQMRGEAQRESRTRPIATRPKFRVIQIFEPEPSEPPELDLDHCAAD